MKSKTHFTHVLATTCLALFVFPTCTLASEAPGREIDEPPLLPGVELAHTIAVSTGIAITPLLGVSVVGAWTYLNTDQEARAQLPWYSGPWFWATGLALTILLLLKEPLLGAFPVAKKPIDGLKLLENKASAVLVAAPAIIPMFIAAFAAAPLSSHRASMGDLNIHAAAIVPIPDVLADVGVIITTAIGIVIALAAFFVIWMAFHAIDVLVLCSPFGILDMFLRSLKLIVLAAVAGATFIHPYLGVLMCLFVLALAIPIVGWSFRLTVFGSVVAWDILSLKHKRNPDISKRVIAFTAGRKLGIPNRTLGEIISSGSHGLYFRYRPWLVLRPRTIRLENARYKIQRNLFSPMVFDAGAEQTRSKPVLRLPPRYRFHEERVANQFGFADVTESSCIKGLRAIKAWVADILDRPTPANAGA